MKRIFKPAAVFLTALLNFNVLADEGEIYQASIDNKPQVLIILDTSRHMNNDTTFPVPERYDPHINYLDPSTNNVGKFFEELFTSRYFYYQNYEAIKNLASHKQLLEIASKESISPSEDEKYKAFVATIPDYNDGPYHKFHYMNCASALHDMYGDLGAYSDFVRQWKGIGFFGLGAKYWSETIGPMHGLDLPKVDCKQDMDTNNVHNPGAEEGAIFDSLNGDNGQQESRYYQGYPDTGANLPIGYDNSSNPKKKVTFTADNNYKAYLYSQNLAKWADLKKEGTEDITLSYLNVAKKVVLDVMLKTPEVKSGLEIFNVNNTVFENIKLIKHDGGRIISGIRSYDPADYTANMQGYRDNVSLLRSQMDRVVTSIDARSALCESLYEGYRYLYGKEVYFGDDHELIPSPRRDKKVESGGNYVSPLDWTKTCQTEAYIIIISAGYKNIDHDSDRLITCHAHDGAADNFIKDLTAQLVKDRPDLVTLDDSDPRSLSAKAQEDRVVSTKLESTFGFLKPCTVENRLPQLAHYLYNNDMNSKLAENQHIATYTVGIDLLEGSQELFEKTAKAGGGKHYNALNAAQLREKLKLVFGDIIARQKSTTASVATSINAANSTRSNETVYYTMFEPNQTSRWKGNLKKFKIKAGTLKAWSQPASDATSTDLTSALSSVKGTFFNDELYSGWSNSPGISDVEVGGVVESFNKRDVANPRKVYVNNGTDNTLCEITLDNLKIVLGIESGECVNSDDTAKEEDEPEDDDTTNTDEEIEAANIVLAKKLDVEVENLEASINWLNGLNDTGSAYRNDIFGDPMHSLPLVVQYDDVSRIFIGTNAGFLHAFKDNGNTVEEEWAFIPAELLRSTLSLRYDTSMRNRIYGVDGTPVDAEYGNSKHIITFGLRRGGHSYYSLNVDKGSTSGSVNKPTLHWIMTKTEDGDFAQLGQTWSTPVVTKVFRGEGHTTNDNPVLIFGAGYDTGKDLCGINSTETSTEDCNDKLGRGVYVVDIKEKSIIKSFTSTGDCASEPWSCISDSIASKLAVLDSDADGYADRIYAPDTGGNIYRIDMPVVYSKTNETTVDKSQWTLKVLAKLGSELDGKNDRRFFNAPSVVRARDIDRAPYDGVLLGSGDITHPNSNKVTQEFFFNVKDADVYPAIWIAKKEENVNYHPFAKVREAPTELANLVQISHNGSTDKDTIMLVPDDLETEGWRYKLTEDPGQKVLGSAVVIDGVVHFNSYSPFTSSVIVNNGTECLLAQSGNSHYYQVNLNTATTKVYQKLPNVIAKDLAVHAASDDGAPVLRLLGAGKGDYDAKNKEYKGTVDTEVTLSPQPIYLYFDEQKLANTNTSTRKDSDEAAQ